MVAQLDVAIMPLGVRKRTRAWGKMEGVAAVDGREGRPWQGDLCQFFTRDTVARYCLQQLSWPANPLEMKVLEPAAGHGAFFLPLVPKLVSACLEQRQPYDALRKVVRAYEIDAEVATSLEENCGQELRKCGVPNSKANEIARYWVRNEDFLAARIHSRFTHIVSNPPYIRWDSIPVDQRTIYRERFPSFKQRADLYVAFIERSLELLEDDGHLGFLCPGSWTRNGYGGSIRQTLTSKGWLKTIADFSDVDSFEKAADAYWAFLLSDFLLGRTTDFIAFKRDRFAPYAFQSGATSKSAGARGFKLRCLRAT